MTVNQGRRKVGTGIRYGHTCYYPALSQNCPWLLRLHGSCEQSLGFSWLEHFQQNSANHLQNNHWIAKHFFGRNAYCLLPRLLCLSHYIICCIFLLQHSIPWEQILNIVVIGLSKVHAVINSCTSFCDFKIAIYRKTASSRQRKLLLFNIHNVPIISRTVPKMFTILTTSIVLQNSIKGRKKVFLI